METKKESQSFPNLKQIWMTVMDRTSNEARINERKMIKDYIRQRLILLFADPDVVVIPTPLHFIRNVGVVIPNIGSGLEFSLAVCQSITEECIKEMDPNKEMTCSFKWDEGNTSDDIILMIDFQPRCI